MHFMHNTLKQQQQGCNAGKVLQLQSRLCILAFNSSRYKPQVPEFRPHFTLFTEAAMMAKQPAA
jgi:hypothetical protein